MRGALLGLCVARAGGRAPLRDIFSWKQQHVGASRVYIAVGPWQTKTTQAAAGGDGGGSDAAMRQGVFPSLRTLSAPAGRWWWAPLPPRCAAAGDCWIERDDEHQKQRGLTTAHRRAGRPVVAPPAAAVAAVLSVCFTTAAARTMDSRGLLSQRDVSDSDLLSAPEAEAATNFVAAAAVATTASTSSSSVDHQETFSTTVGSGVQRPRHVSDEEWASRVLAVGRQWFSSQLALYGFGELDNDYWLCSDRHHQQRKLPSLWSGLLLVLQMFTTGWYLFSTYTCYSDNSPSSCTTNSSQGEQHEKVDQHTKVYFAAHTFWDITDDLGASTFFVLSLINRALVMHAQLNSRSRLTATANQLRPTTSPSNMDEVTTPWSMQTIHPRHINRGHLARSPSGSTALEIKLNIISKKLCFLLWLPVAIVHVLLVVFDLRVSDPDDSTSLCSWQHSGTLILIFCYSRLFLLLLLPSISLGATAILLWAESVSILQLADEVINDIVETEVCDRNVDTSLKSLRVVHNRLQQASTQWSLTLLVQVLMFFSLAVASIIDVWIKRRDVFTVSTMVMPLLWPLVVSFAAIVFTNQKLNHIPVRVSVEFIFADAADRCTFADEFSRHINGFQVFGVSLTTKRVCRSFLSAVALLVAGPFVKMVIMYW